MYNYDDGDKDNDNGDNGDNDDDIVVEVDICNELIVYSLHVALQFYGVEKVSLSGNGLFALGMITIIIAIIILNIISIIILIVILL